MRKIEVQNIKEIEDKIVPKKYRIPKILWAAQKILE